MYDEQQATSFDCVGSKTHSLPILPQPTCQRSRWTLGVPELWAGGQLLMSANVERLTARIRLWLLNAYIRDLEAFRDGDEGRFSRMVGSGNVSLGSAAKWRGYVAQFAGDSLVVLHCKAELEALTTRINALEIKVAP